MTLPISVFIPISPIKSHPDTVIIEETVASVRHHLPNAELFLSFDGVRGEQADRRADYEESIRRTLWLAKSWGPVVPYVWDEHLHQVGMVRKLIDQIDTPLMLFVEADAPLVCDEEIDWDLITAFIEHGHSNCVRLHHEGVIPKAHESMMHGYDCGFIRTSQFSARPHVATVAFYRRLLDHFSPEANAFIEDKAHSVLDQAYKLDGMQGWNFWRLHIYAKDLTNLKRSYTTDGRAGEPKFDDSQTF